MKYKLLGFVTLIIILVFTFGCIFVTEYRLIVVKKNKFDPYRLTINKGEKVKWDSRDSIDHFVVADDRGFKGKVLGGMDFSNQFNEQGEFKYHCKIHPKMKGIIIVK